MKNPDDYQTGWTTSIVNPKTGKRCSGGAARNLRTGQVGGESAIYNSGAVAAMQYVQPVVDRLEAQLQKSNELNEQLVQLLATKQKRSSR